MKHVLHCRVNFIVKLHTFYPTVLITKNIFHSTVTCKQMLIYYFNSKDFLN